MNINISEDKFLVLQIINIYQPVNKTRLKTIFETKYKTTEINTILKQLLNDKRIAIVENNKYRATNYGMDTILSGPSRILRDKYRMHYWYNKLKNRGGAS